MKRHSKASLFLLELIIAILFFAMASALCIQIFAKAKQINDDGLKQSHASIIASSIVETYRSNQLEEFYTIDQEGNIYFDEHWYPIATTSSYKANITKETNSITVTVYQNNTILFSLQSKHYQQRIF